MFKKSGCMVVHQAQTQYIITHQAVLSYMYVICSKNTEITPPFIHAFLKTAPALLQ